MIWQNTGYLLSKIKYNENSIIAEFYTESYGKISGLIFGATSKKLKNYLIIGNKFHLNYRAKSENSIGSFKIEIDEITTPHFLDNKQKLSCIVYSINLIKILSADNQSNIKVYNSLSYLYNFLNMDNWLKKFVIWELDIFKNFGYELILSDFVVKKKNNGNEIFYQINDKNKIIPNFLISPNNENVDKLDIINGLNIVGDFLSKSILIPNNINYPNSRIDFLNSIKYP
tara:strand:- start:2790 stop:3473 length:684 start_codon:yes stop_codon:yes gene_type:complete